MGKTVAAEAARKADAAWSLRGREGRKYQTRDERVRLLQACEALPLSRRLLIQTLLWSGHASAKCLRFAHAISTLDKAWSPSAH